LPRAPAPGPPEETILPPDPPTTPAGLQPAPLLTRRRWIATLVNVAVLAGTLLGAGWILSAGGWTVAEWIFLAALSLAAPWTVLGVTNGLFGLWMRQGRRDRLAAMAPHMAAGDGDAAPRIRVAVLMTIRNESAARTIGRMRLIKSSVDATGAGAAFDYFVLSDTSIDAVGAAEEAEMAAWRDAEPHDAPRLFYRRRTDNAGFKAGNLRDFCARWGAGYEAMLVLDADSLMDGPTILRMARIMQAHPRLGILQSLICAVPADSAFARCFQFGMRAAMRAYTPGYAWWSGDCGPFWGHNAMVRIAPFATQCHLPVLPGKPPFGGPILSHDQVEAALMRKAEYEVRVMPDESGSWEGNPPTLGQFAQRDLRWCQGNLQYVRLLALPGLLPASRFQLLWAILMFAGIPAWTLAIAALPFVAQEAAATPGFPLAAATWLYAAFLIMVLTPKLAGWIDIALTPGDLRRHGGAARFAAGVATEIVFGLMLWAVSSFHTTLFILGFALGRSTGWGSQARDAHAMPWRASLAQFLPETLFGLAVGSALFAISPALFAWSLPLIGGQILAAPLAVMTADPRVGAWMRRAGLCGIPEDFAPPPEIRAARAEG
jgi:membrane glycosyltransferase